MFTSRSILVTGGTGSFGKSFIKQVLTECPDVERIVVFSRDEFKQFEMSNMSEFVGSSKLRFFLGDIRDKERLMRAFDGIDIVIHAAALKQVPACEYNPFEAIKTNVLGAQNIIEAAIDRGVKKVVALSTDKACSPINLYGATKLCSDKLFIAGSVYSGTKRTKFSVVRYGNVAGSRGSVIPFFQKLIREGAKELPITDYRMTRFWLKLESAIDLVCHAVENMNGGELFVKKIPSMKMTDLAKAIAPNLPLKEIGIRPGEKIHEMMISVEDARNTIEMDNHFVIYPDAYPSEKKLSGKPVQNDFEYHSGNNSEWLNIDQMRNLITEIDNNNIKEKEILKAGWRVVDAA
ncbi:MAG: UDP-N-acetylglucosamine 4,6-dehydratase (inverting) [Planctomycetaceae bacterium]|jgi:UDP-N-acetylglucosamine 4,6-dehydratase|nr:UDP-N-acetylglucosamine 4,6-dehydratase (inverting) [Planctomycetaceae bacterium]